MEQWTYFADSNQALIRVSGDAAQRYFGKGQWLARDQYCGSWADDLNQGYRRISPDEVPAIAAHVDAMPGGVFRDRSRFWEDQAHHWSIAAARSQANRLAAETGPDSSHWTVQGYYDDVGELKRLTAFLDQRPNAV